MPSPELLIFFVHLSPDNSETEEERNMPVGHGQRCHTRDLFSRGFGKRGIIHLSTYLQIYKIGDYVDIKVNGTVHKGMPHKFYHGRTGRVWNITKRAIGVEMNKQVGNRIMKKRIHVRVQHVQPSRCSEDFKLRVKKNDQLKVEAKARAEVINNMLFAHLGQNPPKSDKSLNSVGLCILTRNKTGVQLQEISELECDFSCRVVDI